MKVGGIHVKGLFFNLITDFLSLDHDERATLFYQRTKFIERFEPYGVVGCVSLAARFHPSIPEASLIFFQSKVAPTLNDRAVLHPSRTFAEHVVI